MQAELDHLQAALENPKRPVMAVVGGAKVSTKLDLLGNLVGKVDRLVIGGGMANTFLFAQGAEIGKSLAEREMADTAREILKKAQAKNCQIVLPVDAVVAAEFKPNPPIETVAASAVPKDKMILDVGPKTVAGDRRRDEELQDPGLERPARRLRDAAVRARDGGGGARKPPR